MKNTFKVFTTAIIMSLLLSAQVFAFGEGRVASVVDGDFQRKNSAAYYYVNEDGDRIKNEWKYSGDEWYYFGDDGLSIRLTWFHDPESGRWYYFDSFSRMLHDTTTPDGYTVGSDGAWVKDGQVVVETVPIIK